VARPDQSLRTLYRDLLRLRRENPALRSLDLDAVRTEANDEMGVLVVRRVRRRSSSTSATRREALPE